jgi:hypothetical protein
VNTDRGRDRDIECPARRNAGCRFRWAAIERSFPYQAQCNCAAQKGRVKPDAPQNDAADSTGVGVVGKV